MTPRDPEDTGHTASDGDDDIPRKVRDAVRSMIGGDEIGLFDDEEGEDTSDEPVHQPRHLGWIFAGVPILAVLLALVTREIRRPEMGTDERAQNPVPRQHQGILSPTPLPAPAPASPNRRTDGDTTAICRDHSLTFNSQSSGTCTGRGGVFCWIDHPGPGRPTTAGFCTPEDRKQIAKSAASR